MKRIVINGLEIFVENTGEVNLSELGNNIRIGFAGEMKFDILEQVLKTAKEIKYLSDIEKEQKRAVPTGGKGNE